MVIDGYAKEAIEEAVAELCAALGPLSPLCTAFIDQYIDEIFDWIDQELNETEICTILGLCAAPRPKSARRAITITGKKGLPAGGICDFCTEAIDYIKQLVIDGYVKADIEELLNEACNELPSPFSSLCTTYVDQFLDQIFDWIEQEIDSATICSFLGLCSSKSKVSRRAVPAKAHFTTIPTAIFCDICQEIIINIEKLVVDGFTKEEIEVLVADLCNALPAPFSSLCITFLDQQVDQLIKWIDDGIDSLNICGFLGLCSPEHARVPKIVLKRENVSPCARNPALCAPKARRPVVKVQ
jgi:saposin